MVGQENRRDNPQLQIAVAQPIAVGSFNEPHRKKANKTKKNKAHVHFWPRNKNSNRYVTIKASTEIKKAFFPNSFPIDELTFYISWKVEMLQPPRPKLKYLFVSALCALGQNANGHCKPQAHGLDMITAHDCVLPCGFLFDSCRYLKLRSKDLTLETIVLD